MNKKLAYFFSKISFNYSNK